MKTIADVTTTFPVTAEFCCIMLALNHDRYKRWVRLYNRNGHIQRAKPGPRKAPHGLLDDEIHAVREMIRNEQYADLSHRQLSVVASEQGITEASGSSFYREMKKMGMESTNTKTKRRKEKPEVNPAQPNEVWSCEVRCF